MFPDDCVVKCKRCDSEIKTAEKVGEEVFLCCPKGHNEVKGRAALNVTNALNDYAAALRFEKLGFSEGELRRTKHTPAVKPELDFYIELLDQPT